MSGFTDNPFALQHAIKVLEEVNAEREEVELNLEDLQRERLEVLQVKSHRTPPLT